MQYLGAISNTTMISVCFQGKPFNITVIQVYASTTNAKRSWSWPVLWRPTRSSRTNTKKGYPFDHRELKCKSRKSRDTWRDRQVWPWSTKWSRAKANRVLSREHTGHSKHPLPTTQEKTLTCEYQQMVNIQNQIDCILCSQNEETQYSQQKQDLGLTVAQIMSSLLQNSGINERKQENH